MANQYFPILSKLSNIFNFIAENLPFGFVKLPKIFNLFRLFFKYFPIFFNISIKFCIKIGKIIFFEYFQYFRIFSKLKYFRIFFESFNKYFAIFYEFFRQFYFIYLYLFILRIISIIFNIRIKFYV